MTLKLDRMPPFDTSAKEFPAFLTIFLKWYNSFRVWWQKAAEAIEAQEVTQDQTIADISTIVTRLDTNDDVVAAALVRLGQVEVLADGTYVLTSGTIDTDGTIKANKVLTHSAVAEAWAAPVGEVSADATIPSSGAEVLLHISSVKTCGDAAFGSYTVEINGNWNNALDPDGGAEIYLETIENGGAPVRQTLYTQPFGAQTTGGGDTKAYTPVAIKYSNSGVGLQTIQVQVFAKAIDLSAGLKDSTVIAPRSIITTGKR